MQPENDYSLKTAALVDRADILSINLDLTIIGIIGVKNQERLIPQEMILNLAILLDINQPKKPPSLRDIESIIRHFAAREKPFLLEHMAYKLAHLLMDSLPPILFLKLTIKKIKAL